jgi:hypothetical protein
MEAKAKPIETARQRSGYALGLILKVAAAASVEISEETQAVYLEQLAACSPEALTEGVRRTIREWDKPHMMPPLAFILARTVENAQVLAEAAWETVQRLVYRDWHPDIGWTRTVEMDPQLEYAIRQVGGLRRIHDCPRDAFSFLRRDFLAAHLRYGSEGGGQVQLSQKQAAAILGQLQRGELPS